MQESLVKQKKVVTSFERIMIDNGITYTIDGEHLVSDNIPSEKGWEFYISVILHESHSLVKQLLPLLKEKSVGFRVANNTETVNDILKGKFGYENFGKVVIIYPPSTINLDDLSNEIKAITKDYKGPVIPTAPSLGANLYVAYVGENPLNAVWPFIVPIPEPPKEYKKIMFGKYMILEALKGDYKGNVFKGKYIRNFVLLGTCVIKEGKQHMWSDASGRDLGDRLRWQFQLQKELQGIVKVPKPIDLITYENDTYLIMEFIKGDPIHHVINDIYKSAEWSQLAKTDQIKLIDYLIAIINTIQVLHQHGYVHRDITPVNFILNHKKEIVLIDMELTYSIYADYPSPAFGKGTEGFMSPQQENTETPTIQEDIFALAGLMITFFTGKLPVNFEIKDLEILAEQLIAINVNSSTVELIKACYQPNPTMRPSVDKVLEVIERNKKEVLSRVKNCAVIYIPGMG